MIAGKCSKFVIILLIIGKKQEKYTTKFILHPKPLVELIG